MIVRFLHGWGWDGRIWDALLPLLPELDCRVDDRGYFGAPRTEPAGTLLVAHSFGTLRALAAAGAARALVAINGFDRFTAAPGFAGVAPRLLERMRTRFDAAPDNVVADFRHRCGAPDCPPLIGTDALRTDLAALATQDLRAACTLPVVAVGAADDPIVPPAMQADLFAAAPHVERSTLPTGGHLLPLTAPHACAEAIRRAARLVA